MANVNICDLCQRLDKKVNETEPKSISLVLKSNDKEEKIEDAELCDECFDLLNSYDGDPIKRLIDSLKRKGRKASESG